jgi:hypothetical protein
MRLVDWYLSLNLGQKIVVGLAVLAFLFVFTYLASLLILSASGVGQENYPPQEGGAPAPASLRPGASASSPPAAALSIQKARWEGGAAVIEGTWHGDFSSVHCDLLEGGKAGRAIDWLDRSVAAKQSFSDRTFSQEFVRAKVRVKDRIDPDGDYWATCWAQFSGGSATGDEAPVAGRPPA